MEISRFIPAEEVQRVCAQLGLSDWSRPENAAVSRAEAEAILRTLNTSGELVDLENFRAGLQVELKHGLAAGENNITNNHPLLTGMIVLTNLAYHPAYYRHLRLLEAEDDLLRAISQGDPLQIDQLYSELVHTSRQLAHVHRLNFE